MAQPIDRNFCDGAIGVLIFEPPAGASRSHRRHQPDRRDQHDDHQHEREQVAAVDLAASSASDFANQTPAFAARAGLTKAEPYHD
jgi:hypothetical protein